MPCEKQRADRCEKQDQNCSAHGHYLHDSKMRRKHWLLCLNFRHAPSDASKAGESKITLSQIDFGRVATLQAGRKAVCRAGPRAGLALLGASVQGPRQARCWLVGRVPISEMQ